VRLRIWVQDEPLSPDADSVIYVDIDLRLSHSLAEMQQMALSFARDATLGTVTGFKIGDRVYDPADVVVVRELRDGAR
jgi:hypothetical protein